MKILFISPNSPEISIGGVERHIKNLIDYCCQNSCEAVFLLPSSNKESREEIKGVSVIGENFLNLSYRKFFNKKEIPKAELKTKSKEFFTFLQKLIKEEKIGIVNAQNFHIGMPPIYNLILSMVCFLQNIPVVLQLHSFLRTDLQKSLVGDLSWEKIICVSKSVAGDCFAKGISIDKLNTQYLGVNTKEFKPNLDRSWLRKRLNLPKDSKIILHASRIVSGGKDVLKEKGIVTLLESFSQISLKDPSLRLVIAAATPPKRLKTEFYYALDKIKGYAQLHNIEDKVAMKDFKMEEMPLVYNGADIFVLASENETFGQVYIEAMSCGIPVIGTNVGGVPEIITDNFNGFLIQPGNPSVLTQKIEELLHNEKIRKDFIVNGLKTIRRKFSADRQFRLLFNYLNKIAAAAKIEQ